MLRDVPPLHPEADLELFMNTPGTEDDLPPSPTQYVDPFEDVFGSAPSSPAQSAQRENGSNHDQSSHSAARNLRPLDDPSDVPRLRSTHVTNGYREGIAASKEKHVQAGFDEGYSLGAEVALQVGYVLGALEGVYLAIRAQVRISSDVAEGADSGDNGLTEMEVKVEVEGMLREAREELQVEKLLGHDYFGEDGIWLYDVAGPEDESDITFTHVARAHPLVVSWTGRLTEICARLNLSLD